MVDGLPEERDFANAAGDEYFHFVDDVARRTMHLGAAGIGDDAIGAEFIAAAGDADICSAAGISPGEILRDRSSSSRLSTAASSVLDRRAEAPISAACRPPPRSTNASPSAMADPAMAALFTIPASLSSSPGPQSRSTCGYLEQIEPIPLGHAPDDPDDQPRFRALAARAARRAGTRPSCSAYCSRTEQVL